MMHQKIVADPNGKPPLTHVILNEVSNLITSARHVRTLTDAARTHVATLLRAEKLRPGSYETSEWGQIQDFLNMIDDKVDHIEDVAELVEAADWGPWPHSGDARR